MIAATPAILAETVRPCLRCRVTPLKLGVVYFREAAGHGAHHIR